MSLQVRLQKSQFNEGNRAGKWYLRTVSQGEVSTEELADHIQRDTSFTRGDVRGIIYALVDEMQLQLSQGKTVVLEGIGRFHLSVESHAKTKPEALNLNDCVKNVKCRFVAAGRRNRDDHRKIEQFGEGVKVEWFDEK